MNFFLWKIFLNTVSSSLEISYIFSGSVRDFNLDVAALRLFLSSAFSLSKVTLLSEGNN